MRNLFGLFLMILIGLAGCRSAASESAEKQLPYDDSLVEFVKNFKAGGEGAEGAGGATPLTPQESLQKFQLTDGLSMDLAAHEPMVRQPLNLHFDERGRLWVVQYLQYPFPAGVQVVKYDRYLRAQFNGVPPAPPNHVEGADRVTILEDKDQDGVFETSKDFVSGLNIVTSVAVGAGGVWVLNPPYLLFYPDKDRDDVPDGDPEVHLSGFGLEDTHSLANSLHWGPDGWLYGATGSTSTHTVKGIHFLGQAIWRYHPHTREFELFAEGGGNTWSLDFDNEGRAFSGTNHGATRGVHYVQGGYYIKGWSKHGPLTTPYAFGFFQHMKHEGYQPRFPQTFVINESGHLPKYENQVLAGMSLTNRVQASRLLRDTSSFRTEDTDAVVLTENRWFRPVDIKDSPDGGIYIADWHDIRLSHLNPRDTWDKAHGRIYRLRGSQWKPVEPFDLYAQSNDQLITLLSHRNKWFREQARRILGERKDAGLVSRLKGLVSGETGQLALEAFWVVNLAGGLDEDFALQCLSHPHPAVRAWTVRLLGDGKKVSSRLRERLVELARSEPNVEVRVQLASSSRRLPAQDALPVLRELIGRDEDGGDIHLPLLIWWALESKVGPSRQDVLQMVQDESLWAKPIFRNHLASRLARRLTSERGDKPYYEFSEDYLGIYSEWLSNYTPEVADANLSTCAQLLALAPDAAGVREVISGMEQGLQGATLDGMPAELEVALKKVAAARAKDTVLTSLLIRLGDRAAVEAGIPLLTAPSVAVDERARLIKTYVEKKVEAAVPALLKLFQKETADDMRLTLIRALAEFDDQAIAEALVTSYPKLQAPAKSAVREALSQRPAWARLFLESARKGALPVEEISETNLKAMQELKDPAVDGLVQEFLRRLESNLPARNEQLVLDQGQRMYNRVCAACHLDTGQGMKTSLVGSKWVLGSDPQLIRIILNGKKGTEMDMPPLEGQLSNQEIASVLSFVRRQWGNSGGLVDATTVEAVRTQNAGRQTVWTEEELASVGGGGGR